MVMAVLGRPPERAALRGALREEGEQELADAARLVGAVREVAMVAGRDAEHAHEVQRDARDERAGGDAAPDREEARRVDERERQVLGIDDVLVVLVGVLVVRVVLGQVRVLR